MLNIVQICYIIDSLVLKRNSMALLMLLLKKDSLCRSLCRRLTCCVVLWNNSLCVYRLSYLYAQKAYFYKMNDLHDLMRIRVQVLLLCI